MALTPTELEYNRRSLFDKLNTRFNNPVGVCALMGNIGTETAESYDPRTVQGYYPSTFDFCITYTNNVDNGTVTESQFVNNGPNGGGYGLCQWTYYTRKQALYNLKVQRGLSIGNLDLQVEHLMNEISSSEYTSSVTAIQTATIETLDQAVTTICNNFFRPSAPNLETRKQHAHEVYEAYVTPSMENLQGALNLAQQICWDESHGYTMSADMNPDTDCSGLVGYCLSENGFDVPRRWNTTSMIPTLQNYSGFTEFIYAEGFEWKHGDIAVYDEGGGANGHTFFYAENVQGYTATDDISEGDSGTYASNEIAMLPRARIEASSSRKRYVPNTSPPVPIQGDQANPNGCHSEVWVHAFDFRPSIHTWHIFRWRGGTPPTPPPPVIDRHKLPIWFIYDTIQKGNKNR